MYAEAENYLNNGPTEAAKAAYEQVRLRAFAGDASRIDTTPSTYDTFFKAIVNCLLYTSFPLGTYSGSTFPYRNYSSAGSSRSFG